MTRTLWSRHWYDGAAVIDDETGDPYWRPIRLEIDVQLEPRDVWIGMFWQSYPSEREFWVCPVPCLVFRLWWLRHRKRARPLYLIDEERTA
jgi:hypothetical protein